jgi:hypothetical protein
MTQNVAKQRRDAPSGMTAPPPHVSMRRRMELAHKATDIRNKRERDQWRPVHEHGLWWYDSGVGVAWSARRNAHGRLSQFSRPKPLLFRSSSSSFILTRLGGPRS